MNLFRGIKNIFLISIYMFVCGCSVASGTSIKITKIDGVNIEEAGAIATAYVEADEYYKKYYLLARPTVKNSVLREDCWAVEFKPNIKGVLKVSYPLQVSVDKTSGEIKGIGTTK